MADKKADPSGVPEKEVRQAISQFPIWVIIQVWFEGWQKTRANRRWSQKMARAKAAKVLGVSPKAPASPPVTADPKKGQNGDRINRALIVAMILLLVLGLFLTALQYFTRPGVFGANRSTVAPQQLTVWASSVPAVGDSLAALSGVSNSFLLRVETQQLVNSARGTWAPIAEIGVYLSPFTNGDQAPDFSRDGTIRQATILETTTDKVLVAQSTFTTPEGLYWVAVDETTLPPGCAVWVPEFATDEGIVVSRWKVVDLVSHGVFNTTVVKFQIICGVVVSVSPTPVSPTRTPVPTNPPPPTLPPPPTEPPPPTPTDSCGPDCVEPPTPVPAPTEYPQEDAPTPTPVR
ncbi:MAG TPA: hypothetical protein VI794_01230 [Patescibacteria group bacterium]|nr:hypothetical protein [Patescibacteria group bacterium]